MRAQEFLTDAYISKNAYYDQDRSINPQTGQPYIQFGPQGPIDSTDWRADYDRVQHTRELPMTHYGIYPTYKTAQRSLRGREKDLKIVRGGVSKYKIVPRSDPAPELFGE